MQAHPPIQAITFDLDDTLWPIMPVILRAEAALTEWFREHCPRVLERFDRDALLAVRERIGREHPHLAHDFTELRRRSIAEALRACDYCDSLVEPAFEVFFDHRQQVEFFDDALPALRRLSTRYRLAAITNGNADLERIDHGGLLEFSIHARTIGCPKPDPRIFAAAAARFDLPPEQILHVGDHPEQDVDGALGAGFHAVWIDRSGSLEEVTDGAVPCLQSLADQLLGPETAS